MASNRKQSSGSASISPAPDQKHIDLDHVLVHELGQFGRFQLLNSLLVSIPMIMSAFMSEFIFGAAAIPHRCRIPECGEDRKLVSTFAPEWVLGAVPARPSGPGFVSCSRYPAIANGTLDYCPSNLFNQSLEVDCDAFVYARSESVVYDFDLGCQEWLRALAGTLNSVGTLLVLPITGYISDRWGRRVALIISVCNMALFGLIRAFSVNYPMYLALQIIQTTLGAGTFSSAYVISAELVGPKWRVLAGATSGTMFSIGQIILGATAWGVDDWRLLLLALNIPCFLLITYYWILSESVRWLISKEKFEEAKVLLEKVARMNKKQISEKSMAALLAPARVPENSITQANDSLIKAIFNSRILLRRVLTTPIWWMTTTFVFYGLSINSTALSDQMHLNFILTVAIEIPGNYSSVLLLDRIGRKPTICGGFALSAACNIAFAFIPSEMTVLRLIIFLLGKFGISLVFTAVYLYTSELYPTQYRHSLLAFSSMIGRIGSIIAPLTPVLADYWSGLPSILFGGMALISAVLTLTQPETLGTNLPDTLAEAEALGRR